MRPLLHVRRHDEYFHNHPMLSTFALIASMMPMWIFSGVFFSYERFPAIVHPFIKALPLTALNDALRATILEGATLASQSGRLLVLLLWGGLSFILAVRWFRWT